MSDQPKPATGDIEARITEYLAAGGLFNPELMEHEKVRDLLMDCRDALSSPKPTGEWTAERLQEEIRFKGFHNVAAAINAALAAEKEKVQALQETLGRSGRDRSALATQLAAERESYIELCDKANGDMIELNKQLAAEREKVQALQDAMDFLREHLKQGDTIKATDVDAPILEQQPDGSWIGGLTFIAKVK